MSGSSNGVVKRSVGKVIAFGIISFGFYFLYWIHSVNQQFAELEGADYNPTMRTVGLFIPLYNLYVMWQISQSAENVLPDASSAVVFIGLLFTPVGAYLIQDGLNQLA